MPTLDPVQTSFIGGELSPRLHGHIDDPSYKNGLALSENFMPTLQGSLLTRPPTFLKAQPTLWDVRSGPTYLGADGRLLTFRTSLGQDYDVVLGDRSWTVYDSDGVEVPTTQRQLANQAKALSSYMGSRTSPGLIEWLPKGDSIDNVGPALVLNYGYLIGAMLEFTPGGPGDYNVSFDLQTEATAGATWIIVRLHNTEVPNNNITVLDTLTLPNDGAWHSYSSVATVAPGFKAYSLSIVLGSGGPGGATNKRVFFRNPSVRPAALGMTQDSPWTLAQTKDITAVFDTGRDRAILFHPEVRPHIIDRNADGTWTLCPSPFLGRGAKYREDGSLTYKTREWGKEFEDIGHPGTGCIFQGRLYVSGFPLDRNKFWASKSGDLFDFRTPTDPTPYTQSDAFSLDIATRGAIRWMAGKQKLLIGTDLGEFSARASGGGAMWIGDFQIIDESAFGSAAVPITRAGNEVLYVSPDRRKVHAINFDLNTDNWVSQDVTFSAEHLTKTARIREVHFARDPAKVIIALLDDGTLACCTYDPKRSAAAWWTLQLPGAFGPHDAVALGREGAIFSLAVLDGPGGSIVHAGTGFADLEASALLAFDFTDSTPLRADAIEESTVDVGGSAPTRLPEVSAFSGETYLGDFPVVAGQAILGTRFASLAVSLGIPFRPRARTLRPDPGGPRGSGVRARKRWVKPGLRLNDSAIPLVNGDRAQAVRTTTPTGENEPRFTGDVEMSNLGWEDGDTFLIEQDVPLRTEILMLFGVLQANEV